MLIEGTELSVWENCFCSYAMLMLYNYLEHNKFLLLQLHPDGLISRQIVNRSRENLLNSVKISFPRKRRGLGLHQFVGFAKTTVIIYISRTLINSDIISIAWQKFDNLNT